MSETKEKKLGSMVWLDDDAHILIKNKQNEIFNKIKKNISMQSIASEAVRRGIISIETNMIQRCKNVK